MYSQRSHGRCILSSVSKFLNISVLQHTLKEYQRADIQDGLNKSKVYSKEQREIIIRVIRSVVSEM